MKNKSWSPFLVEKRAALASMLAFLWVVALVLVSCSRKRAELKPRKEIINLADAAKALQDLPPPKSVFEEVSGSACQQLESLELTDDTQRKFRLFSHFESGLIGAADIDQSSFFQVIATDKVKTPNDEEFIKAAEDEYNRGNVPKWQWQILNCSYQLSRDSDSLDGGTCEKAKRFVPVFLKNFIGNFFQKTKSKKVNEKVEENLPGIYGEKSALQNTVFLNLLLKATNVKNSETENFADEAAHELPVYEKTLTRSLPLFDDPTWKTLSQDTYQSLGRSAKTIYSSENPDERVCAFVLLHRGFAQLLSLKGYYRPSNNGNETLRLVPDQTEFDKEPVRGSFVDAGNTGRLILESGDIKDYDPSSRSLLHAKSLPATTEPNAKDSSQSGSFSDYLEALTTFLHFYSATLPTEEFVSSPKSYFLGDVNEANNSAILPAEMHQLALGLLTMSFKNLKANYLKLVNPKGQVLKSGEDKAGIVFGETADLEKEFVTIKLNELLLFNKIVIQLGLSLESLTRLTPKQLQKLAPVYTESTLAKLIGKEAFSEEKLNEILEPEDQESILLDRLRDLHAALGLLMSDFAGDKDQCFTSLDWNLKAGQKEFLGSCSEGERIALANGLEELAKRAESPDSRATRTKPERQKELDRILAIRSGAVF